MQVGKQLIHSLTCNIHINALKTKASALANHKGHRKYGEPVTTQGIYM